MKIEHFLFALCVAMTLIIATLFFIEEKPSEVRDDGTVAYLGHGKVHPDYSTMLVGGSGAERHSHILWLGLALALLQVTFFVSILGFGVRDRNGTGPFKVPLIVGGTIYAAVVTFMFLSYRGFMTAGTHDLVLALPRPTAWMIYGVWVIPLSFMFLYILRFDSFVWTEDDQAKFDAILAERKAEVGRE